jgi:peptidoglycan/LPS O-acetylase OafA/YrhL
MFFSFWGSLVIGGIVAYLAEKWDFTHHGVLQAIIIALGGVILLFMAKVMFGLSFGRPGIDAIIGALGALILIPSEAMARKRRNRR